MDKILFTDLLDTEPKLNKILTGLGISIKEDRIHEAYKRLRGFEKVRLDPNESSIYLKKYNPDSEINFGLFDLMSIRNVLPYLEEEPKDILKIKLEKILSGIPIPGETELNSVPRNTLFELLMLSYLRKGGLNAHLSDPNPDIIVKTNDRVYYIECKRIFNFTNSAIKRNVKEASKQLEISLKQKPDNYFGVIALSVEPKQGKVLTANSEADALKVLDLDLKNFCDTFGRYWRDPKYVSNKNVIAVILHHLVLTSIKSKGGGLSTGSFLLLNNTHVPVSEDFELFGKDFIVLKNQSDLNF